MDIRITIHNSIIIHPNPITRYYLYIYIEGGNMLTVDIADNEVIVGFKAKSAPISPAVYVEWQFITAQGLRFN